jgi:hypothetical protein
VSLKFLPKYLTSVPNSNPKKQTQTPDDHDPRKGWMFPQNIADHHKASRLDHESAPNQKKGNETLHFYGEEARS